MPKPITLPEPCEVCGENKWWDNRESKKSPKAPDYVCANKKCAGKDGYKSGRWEKKDKKEPQGGRLTPDDTTPEERAAGLGLSWANLTYTYSKLYKAVQGVMGEGTDPVAIQAGVATLLIQGKDMHIPLMKAPQKKVTQVPTKPEKKVPEHMKDDFEQLPSALEDDGDESLPF